MSKSKTASQNGGRWLLTIVVPLVLIGGLVWYFNEIFLFLMFAIIVSCIINPVIELLAKIKIRSRSAPRTMLAILAFGLVFLVVWGIIRLFVPLLADEISLFTSIKPEQIVAIFRPILEDTENFLVRNQLVGQDPNALETILKNRISTLINVNQIGNWVQNLISFSGNLFFGLFAVLFMTFFMVNDRDLLKRAATTILPDRYSIPANNAFSRIDELLSRYFVGLIIQSTVNALIIGIGLSVLGVKNAFLIGLFSGIVNIIPYLGPLIALVFALFVGLTTTFSLSAVAHANIMAFTLQIVTVFLGAKILDDVVIQPMVSSKSVNAHPLEIFIVILVGARISGAMGMFLAIPIYTILRITAREFLSGFHVVEKLTQNVYGDEPPTEENQESNP